MAVVVVVTDALTSAILSAYCSHLVTLSSGGSCRHVITARQPLANGFSWSNGATVGRSFGLSRHMCKTTKRPKKWRTAAEYIDFSDLGQSIFDRKKTLATIMAAGSQLLLTPIMVQVGCGERNGQDTRTLDI